MADTESRWTSEIQVHYPLITEVALSPQGDRVVYAVREPLMTEDESRYLTHLYVVPAEDGEPIQLTWGEHSNHHVRWSPDGEMIAFLSDRPAKGGATETNLYAMRVGGGEPWALTAFDETSVEDAVWSPDGQRLAFLMVPPPSGELAAARKAKDDAILWEEDLDFCHVYVVDFAVAPRTLSEPIQLTDGRFHVIKVAWLPDCQSLALAVRPTPGMDAWAETRLVRIPATLPDDGEPYGDDALIEMAVVADWAPEPMPSPDGAWIACETGEQHLHWGGQSRIVLYPTEGGEPRPLAGVPDGQCWLIGWSATGDAVYVSEHDGLDTRVWSLPASGEAGTPVLTSPTYKFALHTLGNDQIAFAEETFSRPNTVRLWSAETGEVRPVVAPPLPADWPDAPLPKVEVLTWKGPDDVEIEGFVTYPLNHHRGERCPLVVHVHGGPSGVFSRRYLGWPDRHCDTLALAERGVGVLRVNPRGSSGYGWDFRFANYGDWGGGDFQDILAGVEVLIERGVADPERLGIIGWSYGGYMASRAITQTDRFRAACVGAGVTDLMSFTGTADIPGFLPDYVGAEFWEDPEAYAAQSPMAHVDAVSTPTLIQHGEVDIRVPLSQGRELYNALKRQGVPVKLVIYPRQDHSIGEPRLRIDVRKRPVAWFERWLLDEAASS